jgi:hypothetical protein
MNSTARFGLRGGERETFELSRDAPKALESAEALKRRYVARFAGHSPTPAPTRRGEAGGFIKTGSELGGTRALSGDARYK